MMAQAHGLMLMLSGCWWRLLHLSFNCDLFRAVIQMVL